MKDFKNDSTSVLTRFGRDKRQRTVTATAERVERRPRLQRDAADSEQPSSEGPRGRASYNPHFTADNRPAFDKPRRQFGDKPAYGERKSGDKPRYEHRDGDKPRRQYGDKPAYGERKFGDKKYGDRKFGDKPYKPGPRKHDDKPASYPKFTPEKQVGEMRLNRFLAQSGLCSRREADDFITAGLVTVNGQIVTQYCNLDGVPAVKMPENPNGSYWAVEGICSPDGRVLGKMGHSERIGANVAKNIPGEKDQKIFESGVAYFG